MVAVKQSIERYNNHVAVRAAIVSRLTHLLVVVRRVLIHRLSLAALYLGIDRSKCLFLFHNSILLECTTSAAAARTSARIKKGERRHGLSRQQLALVQKRVPKEAAMAAASEHTPAYQEPLILPVTFNRPFRLLRFGMQVV